MANLREYKMYRLDLYSAGCTGEVTDFNNDYTVQQWVGEGFRILSTTVIPGSRHDNDQILILFGRSEIEEDLYG